MAPNPDHVHVFYYKHNIPIDPASDRAPGFVTIHEIGSGPAPDRHRATTNRFVFNFIASMQSMLPIASSLARSLVTIHSITRTIIYSASSSNKLIRALWSETSYALLLAAVGSSMQCTLYMSFQMSSNFIFFLDGGRVAFHQRKCMETSSSGNEMMFSSTSVPSFDKSSPRPTSYWI